jgi:RNA polymerase sigma-B factor
MTVMGAAVSGAPGHGVPAGRRLRVSLTRSSVPGSRTSRGLLVEYHRRGNRQARERLIEQYMPLVKRLARRYAGRGEQVEDLVQVGSIGLINAIDRFDLDRNVELSSYAIPSIVGEIKRHLRDRVSPIRIPRRLQEVNASLRASAPQFTALDRPPTVAEMAREAGVGRGEALEALAAARAHEPLSLSQQGNGDLDGSVLELRGATDRGYETGEDRAVLAKGFRALDDRERRLLHLAYFQGMSQYRIADEVGLSQIHVSRLTRRALDKLRAEVGAA